MTVRGVSIRLIMFATLAVLLWGCGGGHDARITAELDRADSLLLTSDTSAHSAALRQMLALDTARALQADEALRARHALLLTQARYKCYVTEPADSGLMEIARNYYADHHSSSQDHERYTRALIYSGAVAEELGHPQQALSSYKHALIEIPADDHFNQGYVYMRIAELYHSMFQNDSIISHYYLKAIEHLQHTDRINYLIACYTNLGGIYRLQTPDSAFYYLNKAIEIAKNSGKNDEYFMADVMLAGLYFNQKEYNVAKRMALDVINNSTAEVAGTDQFYIAADSYALTGNPDSAEIILNMAPKPTSAVDSMLHFKSLAEIAKSRNNHIDYIKYHEISTSISDSILIAANNANLSAKDKVIDNEIMLVKQQRLLSNNRILIALAFVIVFITMTIIIRNLMFRKRVRMINQNKEHTLRVYRTLLENTQQELKLTQEDVNHFQKLNEELSKDLKTLQIEQNKPPIDHLDRFITNQLSFIQQLIEMSMRKHKKPETFVEEFKSRISVGSPSKSLWGELHHYVDWKYSGVMSYLVSHYPNLSETDVQFISLCYCGFSNTLIMMCTGITNIRSITNKKLLIPKNKMNMDMSIDKILEDYLKGKLR